MNAWAEYVEWSGLDESRLAEALGDRRTRREAQTPTPFAELDEVYSPLGK